MSISIPVGRFGDLVVTGPAVARIRGGKLIPKFPCRCRVCGSTLWASFMALVREFAFCRTCAKGEVAPRPVREGIEREKREVQMIDGRRAINTSEYHIWTGIKDRCFNPNSPEWDKYGGRGLTMFEGWRDNFFAFYEYMGKRPSKRHSVGRMDNNIGYQPGNIRWEIPEQQSRNRRNSVFIDFHGEQKTFVEVAEILGLSQSGLRNRIEKWGLEKAINTTAVRKKKSMLDPALEDKLFERYMNTDETTQELADIFQVTRKTIESVLTKRGARSLKIKKAQEMYGPTGADREKQEKSGG